MLELIFDRHGAGPDALEEGFYRHERAGHVPQPVRIWWGLPADPVTGELLDRSPRWQVEVDGRSIDSPGQPKFEWIWPRCKRWTVDQAEYEYLVATAVHAREYDPYSPFAQVSGKVDLLSATIPLPGE